MGMSPALAQGEQSGTVGGMPLQWLIAIGLLLFFCFLAVFLLLGIVVDMGKIVRQKTIDQGKEVSGLMNVFGLFEGDATLFTGKYADVVVEGHDFDGIHEYDNDLPPWWKWLFVVTIVFGVLYLINYHVLDTGKLQAEEYQAELEWAEAKYAGVDQEYEAPETDESILAVARTNFESTCATCHTKTGGGSAGPNLTDEYWLHGGGVNDIYQTLKYGIEEKGMPAWKDKYSNEEIYHLASFVLSLQGTNPPNALPPQGEKYEPAEK